jgi:hypothetical protein
VPSKKVIKQVWDLTFNEGTNPEIYGNPDNDYRRFMPPKRLENPTPDNHGVQEDNGSNKAIKDPALDDENSAIANHMGYSKGLIAHISADHSPYDYATPKIMELIELAHSWEKAPGGAAFKIGSGDHNTIIKPLSYKEAMQSPQAEQWKTTMRDKFDDLTTRSSWELETLPTDRTALDGR